MICQLTHLKAAEISLAVDMPTLFDREYRMKGEDIEGSPKKRLTRYIVTGAVSLVVIAAIVLAIEVMK